MPKDARNYFDRINKKGGVGFSTQFDQYYLCLMVGLLKGEQGTSKDLEDQEFVRQYPANYLEQSLIIAGLLIHAQMNYEGIRSDNRESVEKLILDLVDSQSRNRLTNCGIELLNIYAAGGMSYIRDHIPKPSDLETFLVYYFRRIEQITNAQMLSG